MCFPTLESEGGVRFAAVGKPNTGENAMTQRLPWVGVALVIVAAGCSSPTAPTSARPDAYVSAPAEMSLESGTVPVVTLLPDLTVSPAEVSVASGSRVRMVNNSGRSVWMHSYNCSEFQMMALRAGYSKNSLPFKPAGKTCDYFAWADDTWSRKIFEGRVHVR
jgi:hypothetical protein